MRALPLAFGIALLLASTGGAAAGPEAKMYGASWCGPCRAVSSFLRQSGVAFKYLDIDEPENREAFRREGSGGIPLVVLAGEKVRGADMARLEEVLVRSGLLKRPSAKPAKIGVTYGGHPPEWWQAQFRDLRRRLRALDARIDELRKVAADHHEKEILERMSEDRKLHDEALSQLETDASNVSLPRSYRE